MAINLSRFQRWAKRLVGAADEQKRTEITIETEQILIVRRQPQTIRAWCPTCGCEVEVISVSEAIVLATEGKRGIVDHVEGQGWHFADGENGIFVCVPSLCKPPRQTT